VIKLGCDESLPDGWKWYKAQECMDVRDGTHDSPKYFDEGYPLVTSKNLVNGKIDFSTCTYISKEDHFAISKRSAVDEGDILYAMIGTIGNPVIVEKTQEFSIKNVALFKFNNENVFNRYIFYFLNSRIAERQFNSNSRGGTQKFISLGNIRGLQIPLPPLNEQKRIAAILDKADSLRRKRQQAIQLADQFLRSVFLDLFGDPVTNPKGWKVKPIGDFSVIVRGSSPRPKGDPRYYGGAVPRLMVRDVTRDGRYVTPKIDSLTEEGAKKSRPIKGGTVVMAVSGNPGLTSILKIDACIHDGFIAFNELDTSIIRAEFFMEMMMFLKSTHSSREAGAIFKNLTTTQIKEMEIPLPSLLMQDKYLSVVSGLQKSQEKINLGSTRGNELFESLSQKSFAGEL